MRSTRVVSKRKWTGTDVDIGNTFRSASRLAHENRSVLLTAVGVVGTVTTAVLTGRASYKAAQLITEEEYRLREETDFEYVKLDVQTATKMVWPLYIPPVGVGVLTIASIITANRLDAQKAAALAAAYGVSERTLLEYKAKVVEKLGENREQKIRDDIAADRLQNDPVQNKQVIIAGSGDVLCYDNISGRYFESSVEAIKKAENKVNYELVHHMSCSLSFFYDQIGLPPTRHSNEVGWNSNSLLEVNFSTQMSTDDRPCIVLDFTVGPVTGYDKLY